MSEEEIVGNIASSLEPSRAYGIAVSGGLDSSVLLHATQSLSKKMDLRLVVIHVDHRLRASSYEDAEFVRKQSELLELECHVTKLSKPPSGLNFEAWARQQRYLTFTEKMHELNLHATLTAHHADDVIETYLMRILSNKEPRTISATDSKRKLIRPLLNVHRSSLEAYAMNNSVSFIEDETNFELGYLRNRVRHLLIPFLTKEFSENIPTILLEQANSAAGDIEFLDSLALEAVSSLGKETWGSKAFTRELISSLGRAPTQLRWRVAEAILLDKLGFRLGKKHATRVVNFLLLGQVAVQLPGKKELKRKSGGLELLDTEHPD